MQQPEKERNGDFRTIVGIRKAALPSLLSWYAEIKVDWRLMNEGKKKKSVKHCLMNVAVINLFEIMSL